MNKQSAESFSAKEPLYIAFLKSLGGGIKVPENAKLEALIGQIKESMSLGGLPINETINLNQICLLFYDTRARILGKLGLKFSYVIIIADLGEKIYFSIQESKWLSKLQNSPKTRIKLKDAHAEEVEKAVYRAIIKFYEPEYAICDHRNIYVKDIPLKLELSLYEHLKTQELVLAFARLEEMQLENEKDKSNAYFILTNQRHFLFTETEQLIQFSHPISIEEKFEIGRNRIHWANARFLAAKIHLKNMDLIMKVPHHTLHSVRFVLAYQKDNAEYPALLHQQLIALTNHPFDYIALFLRDKSINLNDERNQEEIEEKMNEILYDEQWRGKFREYTAEWQLSDEEQLFIVQLFLDMTDDSSTFDDLFEIHKDIRNEYLKKNKDLYARLFFDTGFCRHLIRMQKNKEAESCIMENLALIPDESIWDLLPSENRKLQEQSGQVLRISYMEMLLKIKEIDQKQPTAMNLLRLQPFNMPLAIENAEFNAKAHQIAQLLQGQNTAQPEDYKPLYAFLDETLQKRIEHPLSTKNKLIKQIQTWLAENQQVPVHLIKKYSEAFDENKYPDQHKIMKNLQEFFVINSLDIFVVYGEKASEITAFEDKIPFLTIGSAFLQKESDIFYTPQELAFTVASELANLYFKSTFITSSDVWKGAAKKGLYLIDTLLSVIPTAGILSQSVQHIQKLDKLVNLIQRIEKLGSLGKSGLDIVQQINKIKLRKQDNAENQLSEILLSSRLLRMNTDRMGLLAAGSIQHSLSAMLKQHQNYMEIKSKIEETGLLGFLNEKDKNGQWKYIELAVRIASLFSFYLSDEFDQLYKELHQNPENMAPVFFK